MDSSLDTYTTDTTKLDWMRVLYDTVDQTNFKINLCMLIIKHHFSTTEKKKYMKLDNHNVYTNINFYKSMEHQYIGQSDYYGGLQIIFDENSDDFLINLINFSHTSYRKHILVQNNMTNIISIPDFEGSDCKLWHFDNRNTYYEKLMMNKIYIICVHRDCFYGNLTCIVYDIESAKCWHYNGTSCIPHNIKILPDKIIIDSQIIELKFV